ncbi:hypothetical protein [Aureispira anguillae]|uniref:Uncharacterized protein n=1 Tax=Aureispira anguillae TaxID=2864201 RepID=A0A916DT55_9BACT|nr:hypothetical protein [Aureispira anguillae]BDS11605.1 hypothetical protein AsAng_0023190 [Aureispira anguillae]
MKKLISPTCLLSCLFAALFLLSSFSVDYSRSDSRDDNPPITKKENRRKNRLEKRQAKLTKRLKKSKSTAQRQAIQKKIRGIQKKQNDGGTPAIGIVGMVLSCISFVLLLVLLFSALILLFITVLGGTAASTGFPYLFLIVLGLGVAFAGLVISIISLILNKNNPERFTRRGFGIAGMIIGSIALGIFLIAALIFFFA